MLFGISFDTASEVALLALAVSAPGAGSVPPVAALVLPLVFTSGMSLVDTLNGVFMLWAYGWADLSEGARLALTGSLTFSSAILALGVACVNALSFLRDCLQSEPTGGLWDVVAELDEHSELVGISAVCAFALMLVAALACTCAG